MIDTQILNERYPDRVRELSKLLQESPAHTIPTVTQNDARAGYIDRYFARLANETLAVVEIDKKQLQSLKNNPRFVTTTIRWKIVGKKENTYLPNNIIIYGIIDINKQTVANADLTFGGLRAYIGDYAQFWVAENI